MRRFLPGVFILFAVSNLHAAIDQYSSQRPALWRSSRTCNAESFVSIATGNIHVHAIVVGSATVNQGGDSFISLFNSSSAISGTPAFNPNVSTANYLNTNIFSGSPVSLPPNYYDVPYSSGIVINKAGIACTEVLWDFIRPGVGSLTKFNP